MAPRETLSDGQPNPAASVDAEPERLGEAESFDVFLSHNSRDKPTVRQLARALEERGLRVWLDEEQLVPGRPWQEALERTIQTVRTAAVLVGNDGLGPWEDPEMRACLSEFVNRRLPVMPVLLPGASVQPELPLFLTMFTWVDLRAGLTEDGLDRLEWGIAGTHPRRRPPVGPPLAPVAIPREPPPAATTGPGAALRPPPSAGSRPDAAPATPLIVSLWQSRDRQGFLCSGLLLTGKHILTVRHAFTGLSDGMPVYVRLIPGVEGDVEARVIQRHGARDAAILELTTAVGPIASPELLVRSDRSYDRRPTTLWVIDPDSYSLSRPSSYSVGNFDHGTGEYVITPENARGHSGGVVEVDGQIIGLLSRRTPTDPLCRAVAMHLLWPWIEAAIGDWPTQPEATPSLLSGALSPAWRALAERVRERVRHRLKNPGTEALVPEWGADPLAGAAGAQTSEQVRDLLQESLYSLHRATERCIAGWRRQAPDPNRAVKDDCRFLLSELIKLAVNPGAEAAELAAVAAAGPDRLHLVCGFGGTADVVFCALKDLPHRLARRDRRDIGASNAVHVDDLLPSGQGVHLDQEVLKKLWKKLMLDDPPKRIERGDKDYRLLLSRIKHRRDRDKQRYLLAAPGQRDWCDRSHYRDLAVELHLGLVLYEDGQCAHLLLDEPDLIDLVREYLELLETL